MDKHTKKCVFRPSRCEYCGAETTMNDIQVSKCRTIKVCMHGLHDHAYHSVSYVHGKHIL